MNTKIVLDCDPANDDALAILVAAGHPDITLLAITTVAGHVTADATARNGAIAAAAAGLTDVPVSAGCEHPLVREQILAGILDLDEGLDRERAELPAVDLDPRHSVELMAETFAAHPGATLVMTGPLTNLAVALRRHPELVSRIGRVVTLGGSWGLGNKSAAAEFNILCDPESAAVVYNSGIPITMVPVDATNEVPITSQVIDRISELGTPAAEFAAELLRSLRTTHRSGPGPLARQDAALHDPCAVLLAADAHLATTVRARVDVETQGKYTYGRTVVDFAGKSADPVNADVVVAFERSATQDAFVASIRSLTNSSAEAAATVARPESPKDTLK